jgi:hypothetical protein
MHVTSPPRSVTRHAHGAASLLGTGRMAWAGWPDSARSRMGLGTTERVG